MKRIRCEADHLSGRCKNVFRSRFPHTLCRSCFKAIHYDPRLIRSRKRTDNKYRRTKSRKNFTTKSVPKVIANRNNRKNQNAIS